MLPTNRFFSALTLIALSLSAAPALANDAIEKPINTLVKSVRYAKDDLALKQLDGEAQGKALLGANWASATPAQRAEFGTLFNGLFAGIAFPNIRKNLENLSTTLYEPATITGDTATVVSTIVIDHPLKKQEMKVKYDLHKTSGWKVVDVTVIGSGSDSMLSGIRKDQIEPIMKSGGWDKLLTLMRQRLASVKK